MENTNTSTGNEGPLNAKMDRLTARVGHLVTQVGKVVSTAEGHGIEPRMAQCEAKLDRLATVLDRFIEYFGLTTGDLEYLPTRRDLNDEPLPEEVGTNTYYPRYTDRGLGTSDDMVTGEMSSSPLNPRTVPQPVAGPSALVHPIIHSPVADPPTVPMPEVPLPSSPESAPEKISPRAFLPPGPPSVVEDDSVRPLHWSLSPVPEAITPPESPTPTASIASPAVGQIAEPTAPPLTADLPPRPITPTVNLIRPTPENSQETAMSNVVALQPTPPDTLMDTQEQLSAGPSQPALDAPMPPPTGQVSVPPSPRKRKRVARSPAADLSQVPDSLAVPDWIGIQTRASSRARSVSPGVQTRAASQARSMSPAPGQKRRGGDSGDEKLAKRRKD